MTKIAENTIDKLQIEINASSGNASKGLDKLVASLNKLKASLDMSFGGLSTISTQLKNLNSAISNKTMGNLKSLTNSLYSLGKIGSVKLNIGGLQNSLTKLNTTLSGFDMGNISKIHTLSRALSALSTLPPVNLKIGALFNQITKLNTALVSIQPANTSKLYMLSRALSALSTLPPVNLKIGNLGTQINKLSGALVGINNGTATKINTLATALSSLSTLPKMSLSLTPFINSLNKLKSIDTKLLATNIKEIEKAIRPLIQSLSKIGNIPSLSGLTSQLRNLSRMTTGGMLSFRGGGLNSLLNIGKLTASYFVIKRITGILGKFVNSINSYIEDINLFSVAMGEFAQEGRKFADTMQNALGIDAGEAMRYMGLFQQITTSMGLASDKAYILSKNFSQLGYDLASFYNISTEASFEKLQSGITGQVKPLRELGIDITNARLQQELYSLGIDESIKNLGQMDKVQLRYIAVMKQTVNAQGDMARTIMTPANALRVLQAQFRIAGREIGSMFIPILLKIIPAVIAVIKTIGSLAKSFANLLGFEMPTIDYSGLNGLGDINSGLEDTEDNLGDIGDEANKTKKELKALIGGFDELNIVQEKSADSGKSDKPNIGAGGILGDITLPEYDMLAGGISKEIDALAESFKKLIAAFTENPVIKALADIFGWLWEKAIKPLGEWILAHPDEFVDFITAIGIAIGMYKLVVLLEGIGMAINKSGGLLAALNGLFPILTHGWALAIGAVAGAIAFLALALYRADKDAKDADLAKRFGDITLSLEEMQAIAKEMTNTETIKLLTEAFKEFDKLDGIKSNIDTAVETLNKLNWKVGIGLELNEQEQKDYKAAIDSYVTNAQDYVEQRQYALTILMQAMVGVDDPDYVTIMKSVDEISIDLQTSMKTLGDKLRDTTNAAFADGLLTIDEQKEILEIQKQMQDMLDLISKSEYEAKIDFLNLKYNGGKDLTPETYMQFQEELGKVVGERTIQIEKGVELGFKELRCNLNYAESKLAEDPTNEDYKAMVKDAKIALDTYAANDHWKVAIAEVNLIATDFNIDTIKGTFKEEIDKLTPELSTYTVLSVNEAYASASESGEFNLSGFIVGIEKDLKSKFDGMTPQIQAEVRDLLKKAEPEVEKLENLRKQYLDLGQEIPAEISKGLTDAAMLKALTGDTSAIYELIGNTVGNSPEKVKVFEELKELGYNIPEEIMMGMESKNPDLIKAGNDISNGVFKGTKEQFEKDKTNWKDIFESVINWFKELFGIHSPSTVFSGFGNNIVEGLLDGLKQKWDGIVTWWNEGIRSWWSDNIVPWFTLEKWQELGDGIKDGISEKFNMMVTWWNEGIGSWWSDNVAPWFTLKKWQEIGDGIKESVSEKFNMMVTWWNEGIGSWWSDNVAPWFTLKKWQEIGSGIKDGISEKFNDMKTWWDINITSWWNNNIAVWFTKEKWSSLSTGIKTGLEEAFKSAINGAIDILNRGINGINSMLSFKWNAVQIGGKELVPAGNIDLGKLPTIPKLAKGGVLYEDAIINVAEYANAGSNPEIITPQDIMYDTVVEANADMVVAIVRAINSLEQTVKEKDTNVNIDGESMTKKVIKIVNTIAKTKGISPIIA